MFDGYLALGGQEIANAERLRGYSQEGECPAAWWRGFECENLAYFLGDDPYQEGTRDSAPWHDPRDPEVSAGFYGVAPLSIRQVHDTTRRTDLVESVGEGGAFGSTRHAPKEITVEALVLARNEESLDYGLNWLTAALEPGACGQHGTVCGTSDLSFLSTCPPEAPQKWEPEYGEVLATNYFENPRLEGSGVWVEVRRNHHHNPAPETLTGYSTNGGSGSVGNLQVRASNNPDGTGSMVRNTLTAHTGNWAYIQLTDQALEGRTPVKPGDWIAVRARVFASTKAVTANIQFRDGLTFVDQTSKNFTVTNTGNDGTIVIHSAQVPEGANTANCNFGFYTGQAGVAAGSWVQVASPMVATASTKEAAEQIASEFFWSGGPSPDPHMRVTNDGQLGQSPSILEGDRLRDSSDIYGAVAVVSEYEGKPAAKVYAIGNPTGAPRANILLPVNAWAGGRAIAATLHIPEPRTAPGHANNACLGAVNPSTLSSRRTEPGTYPLRIAYGSLQAPWEMLLFALGHTGNPPVYWTDIGIYSSDYYGPWFSGDSTVNEESAEEAYVWVGEPGASASRKMEAVWSMVPDRDALNELTASSRRYMHDVLTTSGPLEKERLSISADPNTPKGAIVEFSFTSERGYVYGQPTPLTIGATQLEAHEDISRNLILNPTADHAGPAQPVRFNFIPNPSLESNATGWSGKSVTLNANGTEGTALASTFSRAVNEVRASGTASAKLVMTATSATAAQLASIVVQPGAVPAGGREPIVGLWLALIDTAATVKELRVEYSTSGVNGPWTSVQTITNASQIASAKNGITLKGRAKLPTSRTATVVLRAVALGKGPFTMYADAAMIIEG